MMAAKFVLFKWILPRFVLIDIILVYYKLLGKKKKNEHKKYVDAKQTEINMDWCTHFICTPWLYFTFIFSYIFHFSLFNVFISHVYEIKKLFQNLQWSYWPRQLLTDYWFLMSVLMMPSHWIHTTTHIYICGSNEKRKQFFIRLLF